MSTTTTERPGLRALCIAARPEEPKRRRRWEAWLGGDKEVSSGAERISAVMDIGDGVVQVARRGQLVRAAVWQSGRIVAGPIESTLVLVALVGLAEKWPSVAPEEVCCRTFRGVKCPACGKRARWARVRQPGTSPAAPAPTEATQVRLF